MNKLKDKIMNIQLNTLKKYINITLLPVLGIFSLLLVSNTVLFCAFDPEYFIEKTMSIVQTLSYQTGKTAIYLAGTYGVLKTLEFGMNVPFLTAKAIAHSPIGFVENHTVSLLGRVFNFQHINGIFLPYSNYEYKYYIFPWYLDPYQIYSRASQQTQSTNLSQNITAENSTLDTLPVTTNTELSPQTQEMGIQVSLDPIRTFVLYERFCSGNQLVAVTKEAQKLRQAVTGYILVQNKIGDVQTIQEELTLLKDSFLIYDNDFLITQVLFTTNLISEAQYKYQTYLRGYNITTREQKNEELNTTIFQEKYPNITKVLEVYHDYYLSHKAQTVRVPIVGVALNIEYSEGSAIDHTKLTLKTGQYTYSEDEGDIIFSFDNEEIPFYTEGLARVTKQLHTHPYLVDGVTQLQTVLKQINVDPRFEVEETVISQIRSFLTEAERHTLLEVSKSPYQPLVALTQTALNHDSNNMNQVQIKNPALLFRGQQAESSTQAFAGFEETKDEIYNPTTGQDIIPDSSLATTVGAALAVGTIGAATTLDQILTILFSSQEITSLFHNPEAVRAAIAFWNAASPNAPLPEILETARQNAFPITMPNPQELGDPAQWSVPSETGLHHFSTPTSSSPNYLGIIIGLAALGAIGAGTYYCVKYGIPFTSVTETASAVNPDLSQYLDIK